MFSSNAPSINLSFSHGSPRFPMVVGLGRWRLISVATLPTEVKFRMLKDTEINRLMADATPKEGEEAAAAASG